ncbi:hypothetical protein HAX54_002330, partial [Datura stramonium]|nr:hypothetical protein [Datura stramonium]
MEHDQYMAYIKAQMKLITKHLTMMNAQKVIGYSGNKQSNWRNKGLRTSDSRDAKIEAILNQVRTNLESTESGVSKILGELSSMGKL